MRLLIERNDTSLPFARLRITVTRGAGRPPATAHGAPTLLMSVEPYDPPHTSLYDFGVDVEISKNVRHASRWHRVKSTSYQPNLMQRREASSDQIFEVLQYNQDGHLAEGSYTNVFIVGSDGVLATPSPRDGCLKGITRNAILTIANQTDIPTREGGIGPEQVGHAQEAFLTGSLVEIVPVRRIGGQPVGEACPGRITRALLHAYRSFVATVTNRADPE